MSSADDLLLALASADAAARPDRPSFTFLKTMGVEAILHSHLPEDFSCTEADLLDLDDAGYVRLDWSKKTPTFHVTEAGRKRAAQLESATRASAGGAVDESALDWESRVLPVLRAVERAYSRAPSPMGVRAEVVVEEIGDEADLYSTALVLADLVRANYLEETDSVDQLPGPAWCRLAEKGLAVTAGWPSKSGEVAVERLLAVIDERIADATSEEERTRWQKVRDGITGIGLQVFTSVLTNAVNAAAKDVGGY